VNRCKNVSCAGDICLIIRYFSVCQFASSYADKAVKHVGWDASKDRNKLQQHIHDHVASVRNTKLAELTANYKKKLSDKLGGPVQFIL
jgi:hypothetical protein